MLNSDLPNHSLPNIDFKTQNNFTACWGATEEDDDIEPLAVGSFACMGDQGMRQSIVFLMISRIICHLLLI